MDGVTQAREEIHLVECQGWRLAVLNEVTSTNSFAGRLPPWSAVRAVRQTAGRGRVPERRWVSDEGGLWLSAVVPCPGARKKWEVLPVAAGWAILKAARDFGVAAPRLRWPNDIMVGDRKLAGLLVERYTSDTAVIGVGLNVFNQPEHADTRLAGQTARLADLVPGAYTVDDIARLTLGALRQAHTMLADRAFAMIASELNGGWEESRRVEITLSGKRATFVGQFHGIDLHGRLRITTEREGEQTYDATQVELLRELE